MGIHINDLDDMRQAIHQLARENRTSITALSDHAGMARGVIVRFANRYHRTVNSDRPVDIQLGSVIKFLDSIGYELVVSRRDTRSQRQRARRAAAE